ncbi:uncharacterized protein LOC144139495 isoform X2 [Haemaphysalis longicornis]
MYVLVECVGDYTAKEKEDVVTHEDVRFFFPQDIDDFERETFYDVFWKGDDRTRGGYYEAVIVHMTETEEEMKEWRATNRKAARNVKAGASKKKRKEDVANAGLSKKKAKRNEPAIVAKRAAEGEVLRGARCLEAHEGADAQSKIQALEVAVKELESKLKEEQILNKELQRALCAKIFAQAPAPATPERNTVAAKPPPPVPSSAPSGSGASARHTGAPAPAAPERHIVSAKPPPPVPSSAPSGSGASARHTDASVVRGQQGTFRPCKALGNEASELDETSGTLTEDGQVHLGHGSYIEEDMWEGLISLPTDSAFYAFWRYLTLRGVAEADLPKRHKLLTRYLAQKCADLRR